MTTLNDALFAFYNDLQNQGLLERHAACCSSRSSAAASPRTAATAPTTARPSVMMAHGRRRARRHLRHGAEPARRPPDNPTLENNGGDVRYETDFRSVYARVIDDWLGGDSTSILGGDFRGERRRSCSDSGQLWTRLTASQKHQHGFF